MKPSDIVIFLGPSLPLKEAKMLLKARYFPPAKQGDILSLAAQSRPKVIGLIDGYFMQTLSVWHKEILYALSQGIAVLGASSMGALRAAETADFGMTGIGKIFEKYKSGEVIDDDEVVLFHGPKEEGYPSFSIPLINLRFTLGGSDPFFRLAQSLYYPDRTIEMIAQKGKEEGFPQEEIDQFQEKMRSHYVDQKKDDALLLLQKIKDLSPADLPEKKPFTPTSLFQPLYHSDRRLLFPECDLSQREIAHYIALHDPDYNQLQFKALNQKLSLLLAKLLHVEASKEEIEEEKKRFQIRYNLSEKKKWKGWLKRNHFSEESFASLAAERAKVRKVHNFLCVGSFPWRQFQGVLEELKWNNEYEKWEGKARCQKEFLDETTHYFSETDPEMDPEGKIIATHFEETSWNPDTSLEKWREEIGFGSIEDLKNEMFKAKLSREFFQNLI